MVKKGGQWEERQNQDSHSGEMKRIIFRRVSRGGEEGKNGQKNNFKKSRVKKEGLQHLAASTQKKEDVERESWGKKVGDPGHNLVWEG